MSAGLSSPPRWTAALVGAIGIVLVALAVPRLSSGLSLAPHGKTVERLGVLGRYPMPPRNELFAAAESRRDALMALKSAGAYAELGALHLAQARVAGFKSRAGELLLDRAIGALRAGLALSPAQPYAWTQLALAMFLREPGNVHLSRVMNIAVDTAPYEPRLVARRADLGLAAWDLLDASARERMAGQIRLAASHAPSDLAAVARRYGRFDTVRTAIGGDPTLERNFLSAYLRRN